MAKSNPVSRPWLFLLAAAFISSFVSAEPDGNKKQYIVYMGDRPQGDFSASSQHSSLLQAALGSTRASDSLVYSYKRSFNGFVAKLTEEEMERLADMEGVVSVFPNGKKQLHTSRSWDFLGFPENAERNTVESDIIVGMLDTGIWPESESFDDSGFGPPPSKWKGNCETSDNFTCNNKIIGAKHYYLDGDQPLDEGEFASPRDSAGHGSHTASIAAGRMVKGASLYGLRSGTARGGVPSARIAVYKICWKDHCSDANVLAAFDDAIADGVDIISISVGGKLSVDYFEDSISIAAFHAMKHGILTSVSAGNLGYGTGGYLTNYSPWSLTVAPSTIDRKFVTNVRLGNGEVYKGVSINTFDLNGEYYPLVKGEDVLETGGDGNKTSRYGMPGSLGGDAQYSGKIVFSELSNGWAFATDGGAVGSIMQWDSGNDDASTYPISAAVLDQDPGNKVLNYITSTSNATATIDKSIEVGDIPAPFIASFSSRGPNPITVDILKPDISAPGVDILAAWSEATTVTGYAGDKRVVKYNFDSGTSMACPHATGAAAFVKSYNPTLSPAAIKSALMTTATIISAERDVDAEFAYGSGQINPLKAIHPGLVYDIEEADFVSFLCGQDYNITTLQLITGDSSVSCSKEKNISVWDLNYPAFTLSTPSGLVTRVFRRTLTNVADVGSTYKATITSAPELNIHVNPAALSFESFGEKQSFTVTVTANVTKHVTSGSLVWDDGVHQVRSPVVATSFQSARDENFIGSLLSGESSYEDFHAPSGTKSPYMKA
ncbi:cucumisin-like isoform X4 [Coffea arabica]|uniref:Cucumisin-like isoform X4 n=1 Tax=Coffea arabica TaxID=13443 RepID=A0ABM4U420_COFAR